MTALSLPGERVPLPEGLTRLSDGSVRVDGADGVAVISPAAGAASRTVSIETGLRVLDALGGTYLPRVGPTATATPAAEEATQPAEPGDETTLLKPVALVTELPQDMAPTALEAEGVLGSEADDVPSGADVPDVAAVGTVAATAGVSEAMGVADVADGRGAGTPAGATGEDPAAEPAASSIAESAPEMLETGVWEDPDDSAGSADGSRNGSGTGGSETGDVRTFPDYPEPEPGSGRRRRGAHRAPSAPTASSAGQPTADTPTAPDNSKSKQPQPVRAPQPLEALPNTEVVSASEAALIAAPPVRASICPQGHANPPEIRDCLTCSQPLTGMFSYVRRPALATLTLSTGAAIEVAGDVVVGRAPQVQRGGDPHIVALVTVPSPQHMVSRSHLILTTSGWSILAQDLGSSNGTVLARPGATPVLLGSGMPTPVFMGDLMDIGDGVTLRIDPPAWLRPRSD
ncbi:FHA domain-containing protein [Actinomyces naeslundii]|uniref:FHA domain-containing protein n=1 Tax=Actinomyces naeslundii TaxID=1655 RepID=UPI0028D2C0CF|nr:FHA domain-containing protein [Actinomyces naeslundii]